MVQAGAELSTRLDLSIYQLGYGYRFYHTPALEAELRLGLHIFDLRTELGGRIGAAADGHWSTLPIKTVAKRATAPLPNIGLQLRWPLGPDTEARLRVQGFDADISRFEGELLDMRLEASHYFSPHLGLGFGYQFYDLDLKSRYDWLGVFRSQMEVDLRMHGPVAFVAYRF